MVKRLAAVVLAPVRWLSAMARRLAAACHWLQYKAEGALVGDAEWFDHEIDANWQWPRLNRSAFLERGVLAALPMGPGDRVLELCCGDGFFAQRFFAPRAASVLALDHNRRAIAFARRAHPAENVRYEVADITCDIPEGPFERVVFNAALTHFSEAELAYIASAVAASLTPGGVLAGYVSFDPGEDYSYAKQRLRSPAELAERLAPHFAHVCVLETHEAGRANLYFFAAEDRAAILVSEGHPSVTYRAGRAPTGRFARRSDEPAAR